MDWAVCHCTKRIGAAVYQRNVFKSRPGKNENEKCQLKKEHGRLNVQTYFYIYINCWVRLLSNYNINYICTIYTRIDTCLMSISRFTLRDKVTLPLLKLYFKADVVEWSRALDVRLNEWCCSVSMVRVQIRKIWQLTPLIHCSTIRLALCPET